MTAEDIVVFTKKADQALKGAIHDLAMDPERLSQKEKAVGLLVGLMVVATGHRECVFIGDDFQGSQESQEV